MQPSPLSGFRTFLLPKTNSPKLLCSQSPFPPSAPVDRPFAYINLPNRIFHMMKSYNMKSLASGFFNIFT